MALMRRLLPVLLLTVVLAAACERRRAQDPRAMVQQALHGVLVYPQSLQTGMAAGEEAAQVTLTTMDSIGRVASWFRRALMSNQWTLQSDVTGNDGSVSIAALRGKRPLWITLRPNSGAPGTTYTIIGAVVVDADSLRVQDSLH
jgi:hypothetical protein